MKVTTVGIDLAKNVFQVHGVNEHGKGVLKKQLKRQQVIQFFANMPACLIGMEACGGAHHWARKLQALGHTVRLMAPQFVKPYVKTNKNDAADAEAICEAVARPNMRFVMIKTDSSNCTSRRHRDRRGDDPSSISSSVLEVLRSSQASTRVRCGYVDTSAR
jgi:transposase